MNKDIGLLGFVSYQLCVHGVWLEYKGIVQKRYNLIPTA